MKIITFKHFTVFIVILFLFNKTLYANEKDDETVAKFTSLSSLIKKAYVKNPTINAKRLKWEASLLKYKTVTSLDDPNITYTYFAKSVETKVGPQRQKISLSQKIPFPGKLKTKGDIAIKNSKVAKLKFEKAVRDVITELKIGYFELLYIEEAISATTEHKELATHYKKISELDHATSNTTLTDAFMAQSQLSQISYDLLLLDELREAEISHINTLLNQTPDTKLLPVSDILVESTNLTLNDLYEKAIKNEEMLKIMDIEIEKNNDQKRLSKLSFLPDFKLGFGYTQIADPGILGLKDSGKDAMTISVGIDIPFWWQKKRAMVEISNLNYESSKFLKEAKRNRIFSKINSIWVKFKNSERLLKLYKDSLLPQAKQSIVVAESWYKEGRGSFLSLLETRSVLLNFKLAEIRAKTDYFKNLSELEGITGSSLLGL